MNTTRRRILLIDDTPQIAELLTFALRDRGYDVVATSYTDAVGEKVVDERADALVLDCSVFENSVSLFDIVRGDAPDTHGWLQPVNVRETATTGASKNR